jgi:hypothetical protein
MIGWMAETLGKIDVAIVVFVVNTPHAYNSHFL